MDITESKINNIEIEVLKPKEDFTKKTVIGYDYFPDPYGNIYICATKGKGKTMVIYNIVKNTIDKRTKIIIFSSSVGKDNTYAEIIKYCKKKEIECIAYNDIRENGIHLVGEFLNKLKKDSKNDKKEVVIEEKSLLTDESDPRPKRIKKKKIVPDYLLIFDDLGNTLRCKILETVVKVNRHFKIRNILSFHVKSDVMPGTTKQGDYILLFGGYPEKKLEELHQQLVLSVPFCTFLKLYQHCTREKYNFMYCDTKTNTYRRNFNNLLHF
jgi:hypothetical protein